MSKVSTNAGKHPYLRTNEVEYQNLFSHLKTESGGIPILEIKNPFFNVKAETEYVDKNNQTIWFKDTLKFKRGKYVVDFQFGEWIMIDLKNPKNIQNLRENAHFTVLTK